MTGWQDALDTQLHLFRALDQGRVPVAEAAVAADEPDAWEYAATFCAQVATPIYVSPDVAALWIAARPDFEVEPFHGSDPIVPFGFALLPRPVALGERGTLARALLWGVSQELRPGSPGSVIWAFAHRRNAIDNNIQIRPEVTGWAITLAMVLDDKVHEDPKAGPAFGDFQSLWRLGREFVAGREQPPRGQRRAAQRAGLTAQEVTVIRLRRRKSRPADSAGDVDWSCQWIVRGHWRKQWYPKQREHRQRYVAPYIKGPQDKPLRVTDRAVEFIR